MCGIAGAYVSSKRALNFDHYELVKSIVNSQYNRGPDNQDINSYIGERAKSIFGHNRLSIIDLHENANQPMWDESGRYCIVFNGEIYNYIELRSELALKGHKFKTSGDVEVLLQAFIEWGENAINRCNGMFAFAIFDTKTESLWLFRDRFGIKPLYYYHNGDSLYFASTGEIIAKTLDLAPNLYYLARGISFGYYDDYSDISQYQDLHILQPGHYLKVEINGEDKLKLEIKKYYDLAERSKILIDSLEAKNLVTILPELTELFTQSIKFRLRSDVPVGVALSGGLDSSTVTAFATKEYPNILGFTFGNPNDPKSEGPIVQELARKIGIEVNYVSPNANEFTDAFWRTLGAQDAPFATLGIVAQNLVYKKAHEKGIKVLLGGQGGDESFLGYRKFWMFYLLELVRKGKLIQVMGLLFRMFPMLMQEFGNFGLYWDRRKRYTSKNGGAGVLKLPEIMNNDFGFNSPNSLRERQIGDILRFSLPTLLRYEDRNSMNWSIESRLPFLDYRLVEYAVALPAKLKMSHGYDKWILRKMAEDFLPYEICFARSKRGFDIDTATWINQGLGQFFRDLLHGGETFVKDLLPPNVKIETLFSDANLIADHKRLQEAISLVWLLKKRR